MFELYVVVIPSSPGLERRLRPLGLLVVEGDDESGGGVLVVLQPLRLHVGQRLVLLLRPARVRPQRRRAGAGRARAAPAGAAATLLKSGGDGRACAAAASAAGG